jgi:hypothetical protein
MALSGRKANLFLLAAGGIKEKSAASRSGLARVLLPARKLEPQRY